MRNSVLLAAAGFVSISGMLSWAQEPAPSPANAAVPRLIRFSGVVREASGKPLGGVTDITFSLFKEESGGEPLWFETQTVEVDAQGRYNVLLGAMHADGLPMDLFTSGEARWLSVMVGKVEQPRILLVSVPYALKAGDAESLGGKPATAYVASDQLKSQVESSLADPKLGVRTQDTVVMASGGGTTAPALINETVPATFTCSSASACVGVTQNGTGVGLTATSTAASGSTFGMRGQSSSTSGLGLYGLATATTGTAYGVRGDAASTTGRGVYGNATAATGVTYGVRGDAASTTGRGVYGNATATTGATYGVAGFTASVSGYGVTGNATATTGATYGVIGIAASTTGVGLAGNSTAVSGNTIGVRAINYSPAGTAAVFDALGGGKLISGRTTGLVEKFSVDSAGNVTASGSINAASGLVGDVFGGTVNGNLGSFNGTTASQVLDVYQSGSGHAIRGITSSTTNGLAGVQGQASGATGITYGLYGYNASSSAGAAGVYGEANHATAAVYGVRGRTQGSGGYGVLGESTSGTGITYGVYGSSSSSSGTAVYGIANSGTGQTRGLHGRVNSTSANAAAAFAEATGASGANFGVHAKNASTTANAAAVRAEATGGSGATFGVRATNNSTSTSAAAIQGEATGASGIVYGVRGTANSSATGRGVEGETASGFGVLGSSNGSGTAVYAEALFGGKALTAISGTNIAGDFDREDGAGIIIQARFAANIRFKVEGDGDVFADGSYNCGLGASCFNTGFGADVAERIDVTESLEPGDVVEIDADRAGHFRKVRSAYTTLVAGIVSTAPAVTLANNDLADNDSGMRTDTRPLLALVGRVPVKVTDEGGPVRVGDLLTSSSTAGHAMRCRSRSACAGATVGKALEPHSQGHGRVLALVSLQ